MKSAACKNLVRLGTLSRGYASVLEFTRISDMEKSVTQRQWLDAAFEEVLSDLYGAALRLAKNSTDAEDLVGETVAKALKAIDALQDRQSFRPWIFRILTNTFYSECRRRTTRSETPLESVDDEGQEGDFWLFDKLHQPFLLWWGNPEQEFLNGLLRDDLVRAVDNLPEQYRVVVVLSELEGFSYQEIAQILDIPVGTVRSRLSRARSQLQQELWHHVNKD